MSNLGRAITPPRLPTMRLTMPRLICLVFAGWALFPLAIYLAIRAWERRGQFGDAFGAVNALFSGLAFAGLFWALQLQS